MMQKRIGGVGLVSLTECLQVNQEDSQLLAASDALPPGWFRQSVNRADEGEEPESRPAVDLDPELQVPDEIRIEDGVPLLHDPARILS